MIRMPQKSATQNLSDPKTLQFHQIENRQGLQFKSSPSNQRVLILSTPIKLEDGTINMEQRTIPLRIENSQLTITATENKNKIVSLKRKTEPPPLALPINQLNQKSPTFVKNEIGQVLGKLIPLGKFSNITRNSLSPISTASTSKNLKQNVSKPQGNKLLKLDDKIDVTSDLAGEKIKVALKSREKTNANSDAGTDISAVASTAKVRKAETAREQLINITDTKPKKRVHLVLKGYKNVASIGQTGTKIKLIPLDQWKLDVKSNFLKTQLSSPMVTQPKIVDVRSCTADEMDGSENGNSSENKLYSNYDKGDFGSDILEKDPLDICGMRSEEGKETAAHSLERNSSTHNGDLSNELELVKQTHTAHKSESGRVNSSKTSTLAQSGMSVELKFDRKLISDSFWQKKSNAILKNATIESKSDEILAENAKQVEPDVNSLPENVEDGTETRKIDGNCDDLCKRFGINKESATTTEAAMLSYIYSLKKKLSRSQKSRVQPLPALEPKEYLGIYNLSNIQKRFIESQLRNSGRMLRKQRFIKTDITMARDVLRATGPRGDWSPTEHQLPETESMFESLRYLNATKIADLKGSLALETYFGPEINLS